jgi:hypothetical protein
LPNEDALPTAGTLAESSDEIFFLVEWNLLPNSAHKSASLLYQFLVLTEEKGKVKVLTSPRAKHDGSVDPAQQIAVEQVHRDAPRILKSHIKVGESSKSKHRVTSRILLNKWQRQQEKERY